MWEKHAGASLPPRQFQLSQGLTLSTDVPAFLSQELQVTSPEMEGKTFKMYPILQVQLLEAMGSMPITGSVTLITVIVPSFIPLSPDLLGICLAEGMLRQWRRG